MNGMRLLWLNLKPRGRPMHKHLRDCRQICTSSGLTVVGLHHRGKHLSVVCAEGEIIMPSTPSDRRWRHNAASFARRMARGAA